MSWVQYYKATYIAFPSGNLVHVQGYNFFTRHFLQVHYIWYSNPQLIMYHINSMWCLMMSSPRSHSWGKAQLPQIGQILCNAVQKAVHRRVFNSSILGALHILSNTPEKLQDMSLEFLQRITINRSHRCSPNRMYKKVRPSRERLTLHIMNVQFLRDFEIHKH